MPDGCRVVPKFGQKGVNKLTLGRLEVVVLLPQKDPRAVPTSQDDLVAGLQVLEPEIMLPGQRV